LLLLLLVLLLLVLRVLLILSVREIVIEGPIHDGGSGMRMMVEMRSGWSCGGV